MKEKLKNNEVDLIGHWEMVDGIMMQDVVCERIQWLTDSVLQELCVNGDNWSALYKDPGDGRLWELTYPQSHMHGGGPPALRLISDTDARKMYDF